MRYRVLFVERLRGGPPIQERKMGFRDPVGTCGICRRRRVSIDLRRAFLNSALLLLSLRNVSRTLQTRRAYIKGLGEQKAGGEQGRAMYESSA